jgi:hypothetical protein
MQDGGANLRVTFDIEKTSASSSNKSTISVYNLSADSRAAYSRLIVSGNGAISSSGAFVWLQAGYCGGLTTLFSGWAANSTTARAGADIITKFECGDGEKNLLSARHEKSYPAGTTLKGVIADLVEKLGLPGVSSVTGIPDVVFQKGYPALGSVKFQLDKLTRANGLEWSVQNGHLQILPRTHTTGAQAELISAQTGLIGVPTVNKDIVSFTSLLNPKLLPGAPVLLQSVLTGGKPFLYKITKAKFEGDSHAEKWQTSCECTVVAGKPGALQNQGGNI